jgi:cytochrome c-type biogenesis protein CcmH/NrfG
MAQLKALWKKGADAKHKKDYAGAKAAWEQMLKIRPGDAAVEEAIKKLPAQ